MLSMITIAPPPPRVGTAPSTTTLYIPESSDSRGSGAGTGGLGLINQNWWCTGDTRSMRGDWCRPQAEAGGLPQENVGSGTGVSMSLNGLGVVMPGSVPMRSLNGRGLGEVPNDFDLAPVYQYTPVHQGWLNASKQGPGSYYGVPPNTLKDRPGFLPQLPPYARWNQPNTSLGSPVASVFTISGHQGLGQTQVETELVAALTAHQKKQFYLQIAATTAMACIGAAALITAIKRNGCRKHTSE
jgi:hypothetical protein